MWKTLSYQPKKVNTLYLPTNLFQRFQHELFPSQSLKKYQAPVFHLESLVKNQNHNLRALMSRVVYRASHNPVWL